MQAASQMLSFPILAGKSYRKACWTGGKALQKHFRGIQLVRTFHDRKRKNTKDPNMVNGILPEWLVIDRIFDARPKTGDYFVKWCGLPYAEATWESTEDLKDDKVSPTVLAPN